MDFYGNSTACIHYAYVNAVRTDSDDDLREIWYFHCYKDSYFHFVSYDAIYYGSCVSRFRKNILIEITLKMETECYTESLVSTYQIKWYHIAGDYSNNSSYV
jgi:hypothetical protein